MKAKLSEFGQYVDDQLTDYVVIMVTNKKSEKQMAEDLELFLDGIENSTQFSAWLHQTIRNLVAESTQSLANSYKKQTSKTRNSSTNNDEVAIEIEANEFNEDQQHQLSNMESGSTTLESRSHQHHSHRHHHMASLGKTPLITKPIHSCIGAVIKHEDDEEAPTYDRTAAQRRRRRSSSSASPPPPNRAGNRAVETRSTTVRRNSNSGSSSASKPVKNILLRAVDDANKSVNKDESSAAAKKSIADQKLEEIRARRRAENDSNLSKRLSYPTTDENRPKRLRTTTSELDHDLNDTSKQQPRQVVRQVVERRTTATTNKQEDESDEEDDGIRIELNSSTKQDQSKSTTATTNMGDEQQESSGDNGEKSTKFIVTLAGVDETQFAKPANNNRRRGGLFDDQDEELIYEGDADFDMANDEQMAADQQLFTDSYRSGDDMMDQEEYNNMTSTEQEMRQMSHQVKKKPVRCTFWPNCEKGDAACPFVHPSKPCTAFPNCPFGAACHYIHPTCRFDGFCARPDCPFTHYVVAAKKPPPPIATTDAMQTETSTATTTTQRTSAPKITINKIQQPYYSLVNNGASQETLPTAANQVAPNQTMIRPAFNPTLPASNIRPPTSATAPQQFGQYTLINRTNTVATIPINCKYGSLCKNPKCMFTHTTLPPKSQLKWVAPSQTSTTPVKTNTATSSVVDSSPLIALDSSAQQQQQHQQQPVVAASTNENIQ